MKLQRWLSTKPKSSAELLARFLDAYTQSDSALPNDKLLQLYDNFHLHHTEPLPLTKPSYVKETPFQYHSMHNSNRSVIEYPRLSVTKLLTTSWCQLRNYYEIYSGSVETEPTAALLLGSEYHHNLELDDFEEIDVAVLEAKLDSLQINDSVSANSGLAADWAENIIIKLFALITRSTSREVLVHGYLDFDRSKLEMTESSVLISGIIDHLRLSNPDDESDLSMFQEINLFVDLKFPQQVLDLEEFFIGVREIIGDYNYRLVTTDVKTRAVNSVPKYPSVLRSAYLQVAYYKKLFDIMAEDPERCYEMLLENARRRGCDVDQPISMRTALVLVRKYPQLLLNDFVKLADGRRLGFEAFDESVSSRCAPGLFDLSDILTEEILQELNEIDTYDYDALRPLMKEWKIAPTLRYFAARSADLYNLFKTFKGEYLTVEYHNAKSGYNFETKTYRFNEADLQNSIDESCSFWSARKPPVPVKDLQKCNYCDFKAKCPVPNKDLKSFGMKLNAFIM